MLPIQNDVDRFDDLQKNAIIVQGEKDGVFDQADYILFYGKGPDKWDSGYDTSLLMTDMRQTRNYYSDSAYYFIRVDDTMPSRIVILPNSSANATHTITTF